MNSELIEFRSLSDLVSEIAGTYSRLNDVYTLNKSDALNNGIYVLRQLGVALTGDRVPVQVNVSNNLGKIPDNVQLIEAIYKSKCGQPIENWLSDSYLFPIKLVGGMKSPVISKNCCHDTFGINNANRVMRYTVSINYPYMIFNFTEGCVILDSYQFVLDQYGLPSYPNDESVKKAIENYILMMWLKEPTLLNEFDPNKYLKLESDYNLYFSQAKANMIMPNVQEGRNQIEAQDRKYRRFKIPKYH